MTLQNGVLLGIGVLIGYLIWGGRVKHVHHISTSANVIPQTQSQPQSVDTFPAISCGTC